MAGDSDAATRRKAVVENLPLLTKEPEAVRLSSDLISQGLFPPNARADAVHLAISICAEMDYLLTWNYRHLANAIVLHHISG